MSLHHRGGYGRAAGEDRHPGAQRRVASGIKAAMSRDPGPVLVTGATGYVGSDRITADERVENVMIFASGSASFVMLRHLVARLPVMICPRWIETRTQRMC
jgi:hypothetical protein